METRSGNPSERALVKVLFNLDPGAWHGSATETLWAAPVGGDEYRLENVPFYAFNVSFGDTVRAKTQDGLPTFTEVVHRHGHSTYRILVRESRREDFEELWPKLQKHGCTYEQGPKPLFAVDVPPDADIAAVYRELEEGERAGVWSFEEGHCGHITP